MYATGLGFVDWFVSLDPAWLQYASQLGADAVSLARISIELRNRGYDLGAVPWTPLDPLDAQSASYLLGGAAVARAKNPLASQQVVGVVPDCAAYASTRDRSLGGALLSHAPDCNDYNTWFGCPCAGTFTDYDYVIATPFSAYAFGTSRVIVVRTATTDPITGEPAWDWASIRFTPGNPPSGIATMTDDVMRSLQISRPNPIASPTEYQAWTVLWDYAFSMIELVEAVRAEQAAVAGKPNVRVSVLFASKIMPRPAATALSGDPGPGQICYPTNHGLVCITPTTKPPPGFPSARATAPATVQATVAAYNRSGASAPDQALPLTEVEVTKSSASPLPMIAVGTAIAAVVVYLLTKRGSE